MGGPRGRKSAKVDPAKMEGYRAACPKHKLKDLDALVKSLKGKDKEITDKISEWWDEPVPEKEPEWEMAEKKSSKKKQQQQQQRENNNGRGGSGRGRGGGGRGSSYRGGRYNNGERGRGRGDRRRSSPYNKSPQPEDTVQEPKSTDATRNDVHDVPMPVENAPAPKGAWGHRGATEHPAAPAPMPPPPSPAKQVTPIKSEIAEPVNIDPTPSGMNGSTPVPTPTTTPSKASGGGNVWATKGSAHLIQAEKPKPPPPPQQQIRLPPQSPPQSPVKQTIESGLESGLASTLSGSSWNANTAPSIDVTQSASSMAEATLGTMATPAAPEAVPEPPGSPAKPPPAPPANVLNMGQWEAGEGDDSQIDFGFGSFGPESDEAPKSQTPVATTAKEATPTLSPARPPPGLSIGGGGMPPMPANAVLVHELEGKLESTNLEPKEPAASAAVPKPMASNLPTQPNPPVPATSVSTPNAPPGVSQNYNAAYGGAAMGMYNYNNAGASGFMGQTPPAPGLGGGPPGQKPPGGAPQHALQPQQQQQHQQQQQQPPPGGLYGSTPAGTPGDASSAAPSSTDTSTTTAGIPPPGMQNAMPYNPALFYGQQPYQMGQPPHGGVAGYGYGYGAQFGGAAGFYGQQVMGQSGGYPSYDDQPQGRSDYPSKGNSRYRGNGNQYQNQFTPQQHGGYGYGGQPMGGYNVDHFNQRGGYGHGPPTDPYGMPQQQGGSSNYEKKGGRFQQQQQHLGGGQDHQQQQNAPFLGSNAADTSSSNQGGSGWSSNNNSSNNNQGGGWGQPSAWQGGN